MEEWRWDDTIMAFKMEWDICYSHKNIGILLVQWNELFVIHTWMMAYCWFNEYATMFSHIFMSHFHRIPFHFLKIPQWSMFSEFTSSRHNRVPTWVMMNIPKMKLETYENHTLYDVQRNRIHRLFLWLVFFRWLAASQRVCSHVFSRPNRNHEVLNKLFMASVSTASSDLWDITLDTCLQQNFF